MTNEEVQEYAQSILGFIEEDGAVSPEGIKYLAENVPSSEDQQRIIQAIKELKEYGDQDLNQGSTYDQDQAQDEDTEAAAEGSANTVEVDGDLV